MKHSPHERAELAELIELACEDRLTAADAARLECLLLNNAENQQAYLDSLTAHALLERFADPEPLAVSFQQSAASFQQSALSGQQSAASFQQSALSGQQSALSKANSAMRKVEQSAAPPLVVPRRGDWFTRHITGKSLAITVAIFVAAALVLRSVGVPEVARDQASDMQPARFVAQLVHSDHARWSVQSVENPNTKHREPIRTGLKFYRGQQLALDAGAALLQFTNGTEVVLEGPAELTVGGQQECRLEFGKLVARCPTSRSQGFVVQTPTGAVTDLGTEFGVHVASSGRSVVRVYQGRVSVQPSDGSAARELHTDQALALTSAANGAVVFAPVTVAAHSFLRPSSNRKSIGVHLHDNTVQTDLYNPRMNGIPVANDDLVEAGAATLAAANPIGLVTNQNLDFKYINDGQSAAKGQGVFEYERGDGAEWIAEFVLDTTTNTAGYDITQIDSIASWVGGRIQQQVTVTYSTVDEPEQFNNLLGSFTNTYDVPQTTGSSRLRLTDIDGGVLATRVKAIRLHYTNQGLSRKYLPVVQEVDVLGSATPVAEGSKG